MDAAERIKEAAIREFAQYGYDGARLERIAKAAGVHTAQIHYYFRNKRSLYEAVQQALTPPSLEAALEPLRAEGKSLPERLQSFYEQFYHAISPLPLRKELPLLLPPLLVNPKPLEIPQWVEALRSAQSMGLLKPLRIEFILAQQWSLALLPIWFDFPRESWETYYRNEAPRLFWEALKGV
ncbi:MAG: TetR/AcrR family transcriptional regulator [Bacteroidia bacterium]|nr:TetR/AcrR family transcriptional regulator [Bacteroidia bacterium]MCX7764364.1 TetR/AcrR family transcriptional regulator [Bacteroidia bacterium]MDW8057277.1 helix-turn-helix domain-containing protein [Bacteroidia bacterium]